MREWRVAQKRRRERRGIGIRIEVGIGKREGWGEVNQSLALIETLSACQFTRSLLLLFFKAPFH